jgi:PleD family two-component response regulator
MIPHGIGRGLSATLSAYRDGSALTRYPERLAFDSGQFGNRNHSLAILEEIDRRKSAIAGWPQADTGGNGVPQSRRVLVVDDNPDHRALLAELLRGRGYEVIEAQDALDGVHWPERTS